jgi:hypothetical protein
MTQGARSTKNTKTPDAVGQDLELDLDAWLAKRGLAGEKRMKVGGKWFRFVGATTSDQIVKYTAAQKAGNLQEMLAALLVDPTEIDELTEAFAVQKQPMSAKLEQEWLTDIINFLIAGEVGESSAS